MSALSRFIQASAIGVFALAAGLSQAQSYGTDITVEVAKKVAAGTVAECAKNNWRVAVAVVDTHGTLVYFERIDDTQHGSMDIAIKKANAAARFRRSTRAFVDAIAKGGPSVMTLPGMIASPGGLPIVSGGKIIGAVGVSGVTGDQDEQCAKAGISSL